MKSEQAAFAERLKRALTDANFDLRRVELAKQFARLGKIAVTQQTISGWLNGTHMPKQETMRALAHMLDMEPHVLQYGGKPTTEVREPNTRWPDHVAVRDRRLFEEFLALPVKQRQLARNFIETLSDTSARKPQPD